MVDNDLPQIGTPMQTDETRAQIGRHLATFNLFREADHSLQITIAEAKGVQAELGGSGAPLALCAMNALYSAVDSRRGKSAFAAPPAVERVKDLWQNLLDKDDRTSPEEYPDHALITFDEFADYVARARLSLPRQADREAIARVREAAQSVIDNAVSSYRSRGKDRYIEDDSGEKMMLVPHDDWYALQQALLLALSPTPSAGNDGGGEQA